MFIGFNGLFLYPKIFKYNGFWKTVDLIGNMKEIIGKNSMILYSWGIEKVIGKQKKYRQILKKIYIIIKNYLKILKSLPFNLMYQKEI